MLNDLEPAHALVAIARHISDGGFSAVILLGRSAIN
jgi:hypothetical protein